MQSRRTEAESLRVAEAALSRRNSNRTRREIEPELLGMAEAEALTGRSRWSWRRDCYSGAVASVKIGRRLFVPVSEVRRVITENTRPRVQ
jgi:hypothetical protein